MAPALSAPLELNPLPMARPAQCVDPTNNSSMESALANQDTLSTLPRFVQLVLVSPTVSSSTDCVQSALKPWSTMASAAANAPQAKSSKAASA